MWSATTLWLVTGGGVLAYAWWASRGIAAGTPAWTYAAGFVLGYAALVFAMTLLYFAVTTPADFSSALVGYQMS